MQRKKKANREDSSEIRPVDSRALKSILDSLQFILPKARILETFAGTARFAQDCLRYEPASLTLVELDSKNARNLRIKFEGIPRVQIVQQDAIDFIKCMGIADAPLYDVVFMDPPFPWWQKQDILSVIDSYASLVPHTGILLVKYPKRMIISTWQQSCIWEITKTSIFGDSAFTYFKRKQTAL